MLYEFRTSGVRSEAELPEVIDTDTSVSPEINHGEHRAKKALYKKVCLGLGLLMDLLGCIWE